MRWGAIYLVVPRFDESPSSGSGSASTILISAVYYQHTPCEVRITRGASRVGCVNTTQRKKLRHLVISIDLNFGKKAVWEETLLTYSLHTSNVTRGQVCHFFSGYQELRTIIV